MRYMFLLFLEENICCGYSLEAPQQGASNDYPQNMFSLRNKKTRHFSGKYMDLWILTIYFFVDK